MKFIRSILSISLMVLISGTTYSQAPEVWGTAKSTLNNNDYIIYRTDTGLSGPVVTAKVINSSMEGIPNGSLVKGIYDTLIYGVTIFPTGESNIFQINTVTNVYSLKYLAWNSAQGEQIVGELVRHPNGKYYGMTNGGGVNAKGVIFEWDAVTNVYTVKHHFNGTDGSYPRSNASLRYCNADGYFYGLTYSGGASNYGVLFRYNPTTNVFQVINNFTYSNGIEPNGSVQIIEHPNGDLNILFTLMYGSSSNWGSLCNTVYTNSTGLFSATYHSFASLYFYNNSLQLNNPTGEIVRLKLNNSNNHPQFIGVAGTSLQNLFVIFSFAVNSITKQIYTNTSLLFTDDFPTHVTNKTADIFVQSGLGDGVVYGVTNGLNFSNPNGSFIRKYYPLNGDFATSQNIYSTQNLSNNVFGGRPYIHSYAPCLPASTPIVASSATSVCNNDPVTLSISSGSLNSSTVWAWYSGSCGGTYLGSGTSITVNQSVTTTYYARGEGGCATNGTCGSVTVYCMPGGTELFFSEYIEGSSNNKALEIFNPSASPISLSSYSVELYINGAATPANTETLSGTIAPGDVYVIANSLAATQFTSVADITSPVCNFNGDDAVVLKKNNVPIDIIGVVGVDPGANWTVSGGGATSGYTLVRDSLVSGPETNWNVAQNQWYAYPANTSTYLGYHIMSNVSSGIIGQADDQELLFYPNPGSGGLGVVLPFDSEILITNSLGEVVWNARHGAGVSGIDISAYPSGMYYIRCAGKVLKYVKM